MLIKMRYILIFQGGGGGFGPHSCWMPPYIGTWENPTSQYVLRVLDYYLGRQT